MRSWPVLIFLVACGGSDAAPDATVPDAEVAGPCNTIVNVATTDVVEIGVAEDPPTPTGGSFEDGTYVLTSAIYYSGVGGQTGETGVVYRATSINTGGAYEYVDDGTNAVRTIGVYQTANVDDVTVVQQCPGLSALGFTKFSSTPDEFTLFDYHNPLAVQALTFTKP